jgi:hypothetical protein
MSTTKRIFPPPGSTFGDWVSWFTDALFALAGLAIDGGQFVACAAIALLSCLIFGAIALALWHNLVNVF